MHKHLHDKLTTASLEITITKTHYDIGLQYTKALRLLCVSVDLFDLVWIATWLMDLGVRPEGWFVGRTRLVREVVGVHLVGHLIQGWQGVNLAQLQ